MPTVRTASPAPTRCHPDTTFWSTAPTPSAGWRRSGASPRETRRPGARSRTWTTWCSTERGRSGRRGFSRIGVRSGSRADVAAVDVEVDVDVDRDVDVDVDADVDSDADVVLVLDLDAVAVVDPQALQTIASRSATASATRS